MDLKRFQNKLRKNIKEDGSIVSVLCEEDKEHSIILDGKEVNNKVWAIVFMEEKK